MVLGLCAGRAVSRLATVSRGYGVRPDLLHQPNVRRPSLSPDQEHGQDEQILQEELKEEVDTKG